MGILCKELYEGIEPDWGSESSITKVKKEFETRARMPIKEVKYIKGAYYAFADELATLRLFIVYTAKGKSPKVDKFDVGKTQGKYYFRMEVN